MREICAENKEGCILISRFEKNISQIISQLYLKYSYPNYITNISPIISQIISQIYPDYGKKFVSRFWDESDDEILGYKGCSGEISGFISRLWEGVKMYKRKFNNFWNDNTF